jgi:hypothetical protein
VANGATTDFSMSCDFVDAPVTVRSGPGADRKDLKC